MKIKKIMTADVGTCSPTDNLAEVVKIMWTRDCGVVPVIDEDGRVVGMITDRDAAVSSASQNRLLSEIKVEELIGCRVISCGADEKTEDALKKMKRFKIKRLPIIDENKKLIGVLSLSDILLKDKKQKKEILKVMKSIVKPRPIVLKAISEEE